MRTRAGVAAGAGAGVCVAASAGTGVGVAASAGVALGAGDASGVVALGVGVASGAGVALGFGVVSGAGTALGAGAKRFCCVLLVLCLAFGCVFAGASGFQWSNALDVSLTSASATLVMGNFMWEHSLQVSEYSGTPAVALEDLNFLDKCAVFKYNSTLDKVGTVSTLALMVAPGILAYSFTEMEDFLTYGAMYVETMLLTYGLKETCKNLVTRQRPYLYFEGYPSEELTNGDYCRSFLSGHTALAFASAAFMTTVLSYDYKASSFRIPVIVTSYAVATAIAATRVLSGNHYITDVLAGALLGTLCGVVVPLVHRVSSGAGDVGVGGAGSVCTGAVSVNATGTAGAGSFSVALSPAGVCFGVRI